MKKTSKVSKKVIIPKQEEYITIVKVGSDERPAGIEDIKAIQEQLAQTANDPNLTIVTHHAISFDCIPRSTLENGVIGL